MFPFGSHTQPLTRCCWWFHRQVPSNWSSPDLSFPPALWCVMEELLGFGVLKAWQGRRGEWGTGGLAAGADPGAVGPSMGMAVGPVWCPWGQCGQSWHSGAGLGSVGSVWLVLALWGRSWVQSCGRGVSVGPVPGAVGSVSVWGPVPGAVSGLGVGLLPGPCGRSRARSRGAGVTPAVIEQ